MLSIITANTAAEMERLRPAWEMLYASGECTMFQSFAWNQLAARIFSAREPPHVVLIEDNNGAVLIPAAIRKYEGAPHLPAFGRCGSEISLLGEELFDYRDVLQVGDLSLMRRAWEALAEFGLPFRLTALRGSAVEKWTALCHTTHICQRQTDVGHPQNPAEKWLPPNVNNATSLVEDSPPVRRFCHAPQVTVREISAEAFEAQHTSSARSLRKLERQGVELKAHYGADAALVSSIYHQKATQFADDEANLFADPLRVRFMVNACAQPSCEVFTLTSSGTLVAALVTFVDRGQWPVVGGQWSVANGRWPVTDSQSSVDGGQSPVINPVSEAAHCPLPTGHFSGIRRFYTVYFDPAWAKLSPGHALIYEVTRRSLAAGMDCDFMTGEHPYKMRLATSTVPLYSVEASPETLARAGGEKVKLAA